MSAQTEHATFDYTDTDYLERAAEIEANGTTYRAVIKRDDHAEAPYSDGGPIVLRRYRMWSTALSVESGPSDNATNVEVDALVAAWERFDPETWERFARIFFGANVYEFESDTVRGGDSFFSIITADMWRHWGNNDEMPHDAAEDAAVEWQAWIDDDVWGIRVERLVGIDGDGESVWRAVEEYWGIYGEMNAETKALDAARGVIESDRADMLPIDFAATETNTINHNNI